MKNDTGRVPKKLMAIQISGSSLIASSSFREKLSTVMKMVPKCIKTLDGANEQNQLPFSNFFAFPNLFLFFVYSSELTRISLEKE